MIAIAIAFQFLVPRRSAMLFRHSCEGGNAAGVARDGAQGSGPRLFSPRYYIFIKASRVAGISSRVSSENSKNTGSVSRVDF
jgi:hypothetical protein